MTYLDKLLFLVLFVNVAGQAWVRSISKSGDYLFLRRQTIPVDRPKGIQKDDVLIAFLHASRDSDCYFCCSWFECYDNNGPKVITQETLYYNIGLNVVYKIVENPDEIPNILSFFFTSYSSISVSVTVIAVADVNTNDTNFLQHDVNFHSPNSNTYTIPELLIEPEKAQTNSSWLVFRSLQFLNEYNMYFEHIPYILTEYENKHDIIIMRNNPQPAINSGTATLIYTEKWKQGKNEELVIPHSRVFVNNTNRRAITHTIALKGIPRNKSFPWLWIGIYTSSGFIGFVLIISLIYILARYKKGKTDKEDSDDSIAIDMINATGAVPPKPKLAVKSKLSNTLMKMLNRSKNKRIEKGAKNMQNRKMMGGPTVSKKYNEREKSKTKQPIEVKPVRMSSAKIPWKDKKQRANSASPSRKTLESEKDDISSDTVMTDVSTDTQIIYMQSQRLYFKLLQEYGLEHDSKRIPPKLEKFTTSQVCDRLTSLRFSKEVVEAFDKNKITGKIYNSITDKELIDIGISDSATRKKLKDVKNSFVPLSV